MSNAPKPSGRHVAMLQNLRDALSASAARDPKQWARDILAEAQRGRKVSAIRLRFAREALGRDANEQF
nr:hypothetical protein [Delftia acidovorans]